MTARRCPAEFEPVSSVWLSWPHNEADWPGKLDAVRWACVELVRLIAQEATGHLLVHNEQAARDASTRLATADIDPDRVRYLTIPTDRGWMRDIAPVSESSCQKRAVCWTFNGWARYENHKLDAKVAATLCEARAIEPIHAMWKDRPVVMEGGAYDLNGRGSVLTTRECLLDRATQCRNPDFTAEDYAGIFAEYLGAPNVIWLNRGIAGDDTHGHVDDIARFVTHDTIVCAVEDHAEDENFAALRENAEILRQARDQDGKPFKIVEVPMPRPVLFEGERLPASYMNFLLCNGSVIVPTFNDPQDRIALERIQETSGKRAVGLHAVDLVLGYGTVHCLTHQIPD